MSRRQRKAWLLSPTSCFERNAGPERPGLHCSLSDNQHLAIAPKPEGRRRRAPAPREGKARAPAPASEASELELVSNSQLNDSRRAVDDAGNLAERPCVVQPHRRM